MTFGGMGSGLAFGTLLAVGLAVLTGFGRFALLDVVRGGFGGGAVVAGFSHDRGGANTEESRDQSAGEEFFHINGD